MPGVESIGPTMGRVSCRAGYTTVRSRNSRRGDHASASDPQGLAGVPRPRGMSVKRTSTERGRRPRRRARSIQDDLGSVDALQDNNERASLASDDQPTSIDIPSRH